MESAISWIEAHPTTTSLLQWAVVLLVAWALGAFRWLRQATIGPKLKCVPSASLCFVERLGNVDGFEDGVRASFIIHASVYNRTPNSVVIDRFVLCFKSKSIFRSMRQNLLRLAFPAWPRKRLGEGYKLMGAFFTSYADQHDSALSVSGRIEARDIASGYLLFVSNTYGSWNPVVEGEKVKVRVKVTFSVGGRRRASCWIRVVEDPAVVEEFCPGLVGHVGHESTWNHAI